MSRIAFPGAIVVALCAAMSANALVPQPTNSAQILRNLEKVSTVGRVLYVAAHPDDENTRLLSWLVDNQHVRAAYLSLTRGEGGQNLVGSELAPLLGLIRTQELLAARRVDGAEQLFGLERDFGYSKNPEETLAIWGKEAALGDVVWAIRKFQPDVIVTRFSPEDRETHGHHTSSAILALEAFKIAADPKAYPDQLKWVKPWQAKRIVWNKGVFGPVKPEALVGFTELDVGGYDALLGTSAGEVAARSRSMHKSQGFGAAPQRGPVMEYFKLLAGEPFQKSFLDGVDLSWGRIAGSEKVRASLEKARKEFNVSRPSASVPALLEALDAIDALPDNPWKAEKRAALASVIADCAGLFVDATSDGPTNTPGGGLKMTATALVRSDVPITWRSVHWNSAISVNQKLDANKPAIQERWVMVPQDVPYSQPYWLEEEPAAGRWTVKDQTLVGLPEQPSRLTATFLFNVHGRDLELQRPLTYQWTDPVVGERRRPIEVLPRATLNVIDPLVMFPDGMAKELRVTVRASRDAVSGKVKPEAPEGFVVEPASLPFNLESAGAEQELTFKVKPPARVANENESIRATLNFVGEIDTPGGKFSRGVQRIEYAHIPIQTLTPPAKVKLVRFTMKRALSRIGYIPGAGDDVPQSLRQVGYDVTMLSDEALTKPLKEYQAIVVGVRAFNTNDKMPRYYQHLMDYVAAGGVLVVQYNTQNRLSKLTSPIGPWPFNISQDRVTVETAPVERLVPKSPVFSTPNKIADTDFNGWIQERGLYFADKWDDRYTPLLSMNDPGETPKKGSLLIAKHGRGTFVYTGLAFFRQLPGGVPGAYRLFANILSNAAR